MKTALITTLAILVVLIHDMPTVVSDSMEEPAVEKITGCEVDGKEYKVGDSIENDDPCVSCTCEPGGTPACMSAMCMAPPCADAQFDDDHCCGFCPNGPNCEGPNGEPIPAGGVIPSSNPDESCVCDVFEGRPGQVCFVEFAGNTLDK